MWLDRAERSRAQRSRAIITLKIGGDMGRNAMANIDRARSNERGLIAAVDAARECGPILMEIDRIFAEFRKTGRPLTKEQNAELIDLLTSQAGIVYARMLRDAIEDRDTMKAMGVVKELLALDLEEHKVGKKKPRDKTKPAITVFLPEAG